MVIDTSAIAAILFDEPERVVFNQKIAAAPRYISAPTLVECRLVVEARKQALGCAELELLVSTAALTVVPFAPIQAELAILAWRT